MPTSSHAVGASIGSGIVSLAGQATGNVVKNQNVMAMEIIIFMLLVAQWSEV